MGNLTPELFEAAGISLKPKPVEPAPTVKVETDLDHIAARINAGHEAFENMTRNALRVALDNGDELIAAQERCRRANGRAGAKRNVLASRSAWRRSTCSSPAGGRTSNPSLKRPRI